MKIILELLLLIIIATILLFVFCASILSGQMDEEKNNFDKKDK